ncbi:MAG: FAD-binding domain-containing protein [Pseudomonadota bacterium]
MPENTDASCASSPRSDAADKALAGFNPSRLSGLDRLAAFLPHTGRDYASARNADFGPGNHANVSMLSPYIRHRLILETDVLSAVRDRFALSTAEKFIQEVFWRTYFKGYLEQRPSIWTTYVTDVRTLTPRLSDDEDLAERYAAAVSAQTGLTCFDAWVRELIATGYMHNHARMWFASIWIYTLGLPWQLGADFFMRHLLDGDPASNTLSWRWVGGLHTKGKTYLARPDNISKYTNGRFDPVHSLARAAPPLTEPHAHQKCPIPESDTCPNVPYLLLITEEDCAPESLALTHAPRACLTLTAVDDRSPQAISETVRLFTHGALADAAERTSAAFDMRSIDVGMQARSRGWAAVVAEACADLDVSTIVTAYAPVGPCATQLKTMRSELSEAGISLHQIRRPLDDLAWPHATRGFFALKKKIPEVLENLDQMRAPRLL